MYITVWFLLVSILLGLIVITRFWIKFIRRKQKISKYVEHLPSPKEYPVIGSALRFFGKSSEEMMKEAVEFMAQMETPFYAWFGGFLVIVIDDPDDAYTVLTSKYCMEKAFVYKFFNMGASLFTAPAKVWRSHRKVLNTTFNLKILQSFIPIFCEKVQYLVRNLESKVNDDFFDITPMLHACSLEMVCATTLGADIEAQNGKNSDYVEALGKYLAGVAKRTFNIFYHCDFIYKRSSLYKENAKYTEIADRLPCRVIQEQKRAYFEKKLSGIDEKTTEIDENDDECYDTPQIFLHQLFKLYEKGLIDDRNIRDQVFLMIFAGNDTASLTLSYAILLLAMHPSYQDRAFDEVDRVFQDLPSDGILHYNHITKLEYVEQILRETLRLNPVAPYVLRRCTKDTKIRKCTIPRDTTIIVNLYTLQRRQDVYGPTANEFNPDRFHQDEVKKRNPHAFAPFSLGPRNCIGMRYSFIAMKVILATLLRNYRFTTNLTMADVSMRYEITLKNIRGNMVKVHSRINNN